MNQMLSEDLNTQAVNSNTPHSCIKKTTCPYCGVGCGIEVKVTDVADSSTSLSQLTGIKEHPANFGRLCIKGSHLLETNGEEGRMLYPSVNNQRVSWDCATAEIAQKITNVVAEHGPEAVAFYVSGQLLTEDYYVANKLLKGFIGSANIDSNSRLCMSSAVAAYKRAFNSDSVPCCFDDIEETELLILIGSNAAWTHPVLFQRMERAKQLNPNMKVVVIDPRKTATTAIADSHLAIAPGTDAYLFNGLLNYLADNNALNDSFINDHTEGYDACFNAASQYDIATVAQICAISLSELEQFYQLFANTSRVLSFFSMGINQSSTGVDKANSIINAHLATGKIGYAGAGPFSITGQPNAMGGREVGALSNLLAAHMDINNKADRDRVAKFWQAPNIVQEAGLKAVDLFEKMHNGDIKFIWIMATNPVVSMPNRNKIEAALKRCDMVVVSDIVDNNDTLHFANIKLPASGWSEKEGTVTNSERTISRQRALTKPLGEAKQDWEIVMAVAKKLGFGHAFNYTRSADIFIEHAALSGFENESTVKANTRSFNINGLAQLSAQQYDQLSPIQWPIKNKDSVGTKRLFTDNQFYTPSGKAQFITITPVMPQQVTSEQYPLVLNTGRMRDQWHTMTRTGKAARLTQHSDQAMLHISAHQAQQHHLVAGELVEMYAATNTDKAVIMPIKIDDGMLRNEVFAPIHWSKTWGSHLNLTALFTDANDPISGQPELKHAAVRLQKVTFEHYANLYCAKALPVNLLNDMADYWSHTPLENGFFYRLSNATHHPTWIASLSSNIQAYLVAQDTEINELITGHLALQQSAVMLKDDKLVCSITTATHKPQENSQWINDLLEKPIIEKNDLSALIRALPPADFTEGNLICSCFNVREHAIEHAIQQGCATVEALGDTLQCGTNCGSCRSELAQMITKHRAIIPTLTIAGDL